MGVAQVATDSDAAVMLAAMDAAPELVYATPAATAPPPAVGRSSARRARRASGARGGNGTGTGSVAVGNSECDPHGDWSTNFTWRADATYPAMVARILAQVRRRDVCRCLRIFSSRYHERVTAGDGRADPRAQHVVEIAENDTLPPYDLLRSCALPEDTRRLLRVV